MKHCLVTLIVRDGESEYYIRHSHKIPQGMTKEEVADYEAKHWYAFDTEDEDDFPEAKDGGYYHLGGEIFVEVELVQDLPEEHYATLQNYGI